MIMRRLAILFFSLLSSVSVLAQEVKPSQTGLTVEKILARYVQAIGGEAAWRKLTSRTMTMSAAIPKYDVTINVQIFAQAPNKFVEIDEVKVGQAVVYEFSNGFNGVVGWSYKDGFHELDGTELAEAKSSAEFYRDFKLKELYPQMTFKGKVAIGGYIANCIEAVPTSGSAEKWYFATQTGLLVRVDSFDQGAGKKPSSSVTYFEDYREVDGIKLPFSIRSPKKKLTYKVNEPHQLRPFLIIVRRISPA